MILDGIFAWFAAPILKPMSTRDFELLVETHYEDLYRFAFSLARNPDEASDLTQQTFAIYAEKGDQIREVEKRKNWLFTTLYREFLKSRARSRRQVSLEESGLEMNHPAEDSSVQRGSEQRELLAALAALGEDQRAILTLFYLDQHSYKEIAVILGIPTGTVMSRLSRAKEALRMGYERGSQDEENIIRLPAEKRKDVANG